MYVRNRRAFRTGVFLTLSYMAIHVALWMAMYAAPLLHLPKVCAYVVCKVLKVSMLQRFERFGFVEKGSFSTEIVEIIRSDLMIASPLKW